MGSDNQVDGLEFVARKPDGTKIYRGRKWGYRAVYPDGVVQDALEMARLVWADPVTHWYCQVLPNGSVYEVKMIVRRGHCKGGNGSGDCNLCVSICPRKAISYSSLIDQWGFRIPEPGYPGAEKCTACEQCTMMCPDEAFVEVRRTRIHELTLWTSNAGEEASDGDEAVTQKMS